jgi:hypothetical protein
MRGRACALIGNMEPPFDRRIHGLESEVSFSRTVNYYAINLISPNSLLIIAATVPEYAL